MEKLKKILLVDDDPTNNYLNERLLKSLQIAEEVKVLTDGKLALDYILENCFTENHYCPGLVILDHHMPVMDGLELMEALNKNGIIKSLEIVFLLLAVHTKPEEQEAFRKLGVQEFTPKPLSKRTIREAHLKYWEGDTAKNHAKGSAK
ncbi:response regulator [Adhaeribacter radiodurans]|uniref:Response regulator n=1 Tax=Adhaeribacter radiodurans TaxID=2745197 RepID=A0A7L7L9M5_9BACT|nr:response regulator [Adhaeribacter radiodurans]QMU29530.1 response regulator [Adhaeribacter radiodurans]